MVDAVDLMDSVDLAESVESTESVKLMGLVEWVDLWMLCGIKAVPNAML